jgi:hypothetical protein
MQDTILILEEDQGMHVAQKNPVDEASPEFCAGRKVTETHKALLWKLLNDDPHCPSRLVLHTITETQTCIPHIVIRVCVAMFAKTCHLAMLP